MATIVGVFLFFNIKNENITEAEALRQRTIQARSTDKNSDALKNELTKIKKMLFAKTKSFEERIKVLENKLAEKKEEPVEEEVAKKEPQEKEEIKEIKQEKKVVEKEEIIPNEFEVNFLSEINKNKEKFSELDKDKDGFLTLEESAIEENKFFSLDRNRDNKITKNELNLLAFDYKKAEEWIKEMDKDEDNAVSVKEFKGWKTKFHYLDKDKNNIISAVEYINYRNDLRALIVKYDSNRDGKITKKEFDNDERFANLDRKKDGVLDINDIGSALIKGQIGLRH